MEFTTTPAAPRRLIRRLIPWTMSLGLFAGGGYGVYTYAVPTAADPMAVATPSADPFAMPKSAAANDQIKQLFASSPSAARAGTSPSASTASASMVQPSAYSRYASAPSMPPVNMASAPPQLPPAREPQRDAVATPRSADSLAPQQNPFATLPSSSAGDRYQAASLGQSERDQPPVADAASAAMVTPAAAESTVSVAAASTAEASSSAVSDPADVARGQEPVSVNPLRAGVKAAAPTEVAGQGNPFGSSSSEPAPVKVGALGPADASSAPPTAESPSRYLGSSAAAQAFGSSTPATAPEAEDYADAKPMPVGPAASATSPFPPASIAASASPAARQQAPTFVAEVQPPAHMPVASANASPVTEADPVAVGAGRPGERILEGVQNSAISIQKLAPPEIQVGRKCTMQIRIKNNSQQSAHNVEVRDEVPFGTQLIGTAPKAAVAGSQVTWDLATLSPGDERIVEMELLPTEEGELGSVATVSFAAQASTKVRCTRPQLALRLSSGPRVMIGQQQLVEIEIANPGTGDATGVMLLETVPQGVSHEAGPALEFEVGTLHAGESKRLDLVLTAEQAGRVTNSMTARADANLEVEAACEFEVIAPDLKVSVEGPKQRYLERPATYTVSVDNPGTASAKEVQLITHLPKGLQYVSANNMGEYDAATHSIHWSLAELPANEQGKVELVALPVEPGEHTLKVTSRAEQGLEDQTEASVHVEGLVVLSFEVKSVDGAIPVGSETSYEVAVVNEGSKPAANVQVVAAMPQGLRAMSGQGATRAVIEGDKLVFAPLAQLAPKAEAKFRVQVQGLRAGDLRAKIMVTADEVPQPITKEQSTHVYADQ
jgi:uncharacterized repeat protein (TIGR01451 family)